MEKKHLKMDVFGQINTPISSLNLKTSEAASNSVFCVCCLAQNVTSVALTNCKHKSFFENLFPYKVEDQHSVICNQCHNFLKKIEAFKAQVHKCNAILSGQSLDHKLQSKCPQKLVITRTLVTANTDLQIEQYKVEQHEVANSQQEPYTELDTEIKIEPGSGSDFECDVPLSEIKKAVRKKKKKKLKKAKEIPEPKIKAGTGRKQRTNLREKYHGKITIVTLSREELMLEREKDATKEAYLKLPYKCENCITGFDHELNLKDHMEKRHGEKKGGHVCDICKSVLKNVTTYKEHMRRHSLRYECVECGKRNNNVYSVAQHYNTYHGSIDTEFTCDECGFSTSSHRSYRYHRDKHKQKQQCSICESTFVNATSLRVHMFTVHKQSSRVYSCAECGRVYKAKSGLSAHAAAAHGARGGRAAYCAPCQRHFRAPHNLRHHLRTHSAHVSPDSKLICDECGAKFITKVSLQEHIDFVHLKSTKYTCPTCKRVFQNGSSLKKHDDFVHKKLRPPRNKICDICGRGFTSLSVLRSHVWAHAGARPLRCARCPAAFAHAAARYTHTRLLHPTAHASTLTTTA